MFYLALGLHVIASLFLILVVLLQTGKGGDISSAFGGGGSGAALGPRGAGNVLTKATTVSAIVFMITSLTLVMLYQDGAANRDAGLEEALTQPAAGATAPAETPSETSEDDGAADSAAPAEGNDGGDSDSQP